LALIYRAQEGARDQVLAERTQTGRAAGRSGLADLPGVALHGRAADGAGNAHGPSFRHSIPAQQDGDGPLEPVAHLRHRQSELAG